jgi:hypothetical protein
VVWAVPDLQKKQEYQLKRLTLVAGITLAVSVPAAANAKPVTPGSARHYSHLYQHVAAKFGRRAPGRNIVRWGFAHGRRVSDAQVVTSIGVLERMLAPPPPAPPRPAVVRTAVAPAAESATPVTHTVASVSSSSVSAAPTGSSLPACTWQPESGGNPSAVNPSSGAGGYYQIMPSTWSAYGGSGAPQDAPMSEQTAIAQKIYHSQGAGAWVNC